MTTTPPIEVPILARDKFIKEFDRVLAKTRQANAAIASSGSFLTSRLTLPIVGAGVASVILGRNLNKAMANVATLIPEETQKIYKYKKEVEQLAIAMGGGAQSADIMANGLYQIISVFGDSSETIKNLEIAAKAAKAGVTDTAEAVNLISSVTKAYGDTSAKAQQKVSDLSFLTVKLGSTTFPELASSMSDVTSIASTMKISQEELYSGFATLSGVTGNTSRVATRLSGIMGALIKPTTEMSRLVKKLGYDSTTSMVQQLGFIGTLETLNKAVKGNVEKVGELIVSREALPAFFALTGKQAGKFRENLNFLNNAIGATDAAFKAQTEGIDKAGFAFDQSVESAKMAAGAFGDRLLPVLSKLLLKVEPLLKSWTEMSDEQIEARLKFLGFIAVLGPSLSIISRFNSVLITTKSLLGPDGLKGAFQKLNSPIGGINKNLSTTNAQLEKIGKSAKILAGLEAGITAGLVGHGIGTLLNEFIFDPQNEKQSKLMRSVESFTSKKGGTKAEKIQQYWEADKAKKELLGKNGLGMMTTENIMGSFGSMLTGNIEENPLFRSLRGMQDLTKVQGELLTQIRSGQYAPITKPVKTELDVNVNINGAPPGTTGSVKSRKKDNTKSKMKINSTGQLMGEAL